MNADQIASSLITTNQEWRAGYEKAFDDAFEALGECSDMKLDAATLLAVSLKLMQKKGGSES